MHALIVAGPTCSGKSALAVELARACGGVVINADSMQVYRELSVLTARPTPSEQGDIPHVLYGVRPAADPGSVAWWREVALAEMAAAHEAGKLPILCGGTGLYFAALCSGLADVPAIDPAVREAARALLAAEGAAALHARLAQADPRTAASLRPSDGQRLARAWEVLGSTGRGLAAWQDHAPAPTPWRFTSIRLDPPREDLRLAIAVRFATMLDQGALDEMRHLLALALSPTLPAMRAHGVAELADHLRGACDLAEATRRTTLATTQYTKRQATWFRHRILAEAGRTHIIHARFTGLAQFPADMWRALVSFVRAGG